MKTKTSLKQVGIFQVILLIISIFAIAWVIGSSMEIVSAEGDLCDFSTPCPAGESCSVDVSSGEIGRCIKDAPEPVEYQESSGGNEDSGGNFLGTASSVISIGGGALGILDNKWIKGVVGKKTATEVANTGVKTTSVGTEKLVATGTDKLVTTSADKLTTPTLSGSKSSEFGGDFLSKSLADAKGTAPVTEPTSTTIPCSGCGSGSFTSVLGTFAGAAAAAFAVAYGYAYLFDLLGASSRNVDMLMDAALYVALASAVATTVLFEVAGGAGAVWLATALGLAAVPGVGWVAAAVALIVMAIVTVVNYQDYSQEIFNYYVQTWQPPEGGEDCLKCNDLRYGCSEYQCRSFGQACEITNQGTSDEKCVWVNKNDLLPPELTPIDEVLKEGYSYTPAHAVLPNERGVRINYEGNEEGCIPPFTNITLGVATNEPASCKIDLERKFEFDDLMSYMVEGSSNVYNHTLPIPSSAAMSTSALENLNITISNDNEYVFFIRCKDVNGNPTTSNFLMEFCVDQGPDTMAPIIESTSYAQDSYVSYNKTTVPLEVYTNEPADCRWDFQDLEYDSMTNNMTDCSQAAGDYFRSYFYGCATNLTGIQNEQTNNYYIKCEDQPWFETDPEKKHLRNENKQSYVLSLTGTTPLIIDEILVNNRPNNSTIKDATDVIKTTLKVKTLAGAEEGKARCAYKVDNNFVHFYNNGIPEYLIENTQPLWLTPGDYNYTIRCEDKGGNVDYSDALFTVEKDVYAPQISRVYKEQDNLKLITDEPAQCVYSIVENCNYEFEDGTEIISLDTLNHFVAWDTETNYYIKCMDKFGNYPVPQNQCSIVVRGSEYSSD